MITMISHTHVGRPSATQMQRWPGCTRGRAYSTCDGDTGFGFGIVRALAFKHVRSKGTAIDQGIIMRANLRNAEGKQTDAPAVSRTPPGAPARP